jgi:DNA-binding NtrC family response regulator
VPTVLIVDDDAPVRDMLAMVLRSDGFTVLTAKNGNEALRIAHLGSQPFDLLVSDLEMPGIDGEHLASAIRDEHPSLPVLLISGCGRLIDVPSLPICGFFSKPLHLPAFLKAVRRLIAKRPKSAAA